MLKQYPYINLTDLNLDFILKAIREMEHKVNDFVSINAVKYANPIQWNITRQYEKNTVVIDPLTGTAFISVREVPTGVSLTRTEYWTVIFDLSEFISKGAANFANSYERNITTTATMNTNVGDWLVWDSTLYIALTSIHAGDAYVPNGNIKRMTVEDFYDLLMAAIHSLDDEIDAEILNRQNADNALGDRIDDEIQNRINADNALGDRIDDEIRNRIDADNSLGDRIDNEIQNRIDADNSLGDRIDDEIQNRINADNALGGRIDDEIQNRIDADNALRQEIYSASKYKETYINVKAYGAIGDGNLHPLSEFYSSLNAAKVVYPAATSINQSIDSAAIQKAINDASGVYIPKGNYVINVTIVFPQAIEQKIVGDGTRTTILTGAMDSGEMFGYVRDSSVGGKVLTFKDISFTGTANINAIYFGGVLVDNHRYEDNWLNIYNCDFTSLNDGVVLTYCGNCNFEHIWATNMRYVFNLNRAASFIRAFQVFTMDVSSLLFADDPIDDGVSNGIELIECEAIFSRAVAFRVLGWQGVYLIRCSADLSSVQGDNVFIYKCEDVSITDCWIAGANAPNSIGLRLWESRDVYVSGCTIQNCNFGVRIDGIPNFKDNAITIHGCAIEGCANNDVLVLNTRGLILSHNSFLDNITLAGSNAPVYCANCAWSIVTENKFWHEAYQIDLAASVAGNNVFITS